MTLGDKIRLIRKEKKISIRKLSEMTGLSKSTLSDIENNKSKKPTVDTISRVAKALEVPLADLFEQNSVNNASTDNSGNNADVASPDLSQVFLRSVARAKNRPKEVQDKIASFIELILDQEENKWKKEWIYGKKNSFIS